MRRYRPVALYLLCMAALSGFLYLDGAVWHHTFPQGFVLFLVCLIMGLSLVLAGFTALLIWFASKTIRPEYPKEVKNDLRIGRKARHLLDGCEGTITAIYRWKDGYEHIDITQGAITCHAKGTNVELLD